MDALGWDSCDIIIVTGDAYVDHPSFGMAVIGRMLEAQGFRVGIIAQPDWQSAEPFKALGKPNLFFGVTAGNMDSMINRYTADRKIRSDDAYTPGDVGGKRPDRAAHRLLAALQAKPGTTCRSCSAASKASLRRIAHYDYWQDKVRRSILVDAKCDLLLYGNAERAIVEIAHRLAAREPVAADHRRARHRLRAARRRPRAGSRSTRPSVDEPGRVDAHINPYLMVSEQAKANGATCAKEDEAQARPTAAAADPAIKPLTFVPNPARRARGSVQGAAARPHGDPPAVLRAGASRPGALRPRQPRAAPGDQPRQCARAGAGARRGTTARDVWINPPPIPLTTAEMDYVFDLPYARSPHPRYADEHGSHDGATKIPAWEMIRFTVNIMRGCFGGCTFCSITEHEGRIIQSRSRRLDHPRDRGHPRQGQGLHRHHLRPGRPDRQHVPHRLQEPGDRSRLPQAQLRVPGHLPEPEHQPRSADQDLPPRARAARASRRS